MLAGGLRRRFWAGLSGRERSRTVRGTPRETPIPRHRERGRVVCAPVPAAENSASFAKFVEGQLGRRHRSFQGYAQLLLKNALIATQLFGPCFISRLRWGTQLLKAHPPNIAFSVSPDGLPSALWTSSSRPGSRGIGMARLYGRRRPKDQRNETSSRSICHRVGAVSDWVPDVLSTRVAVAV